MSADRPVRAVRKDAVRNRIRLITAAREVFAARGFTATLDEIARHAGVGTGTAYRHFANKAEVAAAVVTEVSRELVDDAEAAGRIDDPWEALVSFFEVTAARQAVDRGLHLALSGHGDEAAQAAIWPQIIDAIGRLFDRARTAGVIRADADPADALPIIAMLAVAGDISEATTPDLWRRYLALMLDGLRAGNRPPLPVPPLALDELATAISASRRRHR